jgi:hypothetical protein
MKKANLLRCARSTRSNVLHESVSGLACPERKPKDRVFARLASWTFLIGLQSRLLKSRHGRQFCLFVRILVVILGVCPAQAIAQEKIRIAPSSPGLSAWPVHLAAKEKFFAGEGLDAEVIVMRTNVGIAALVTGSIDFTTAGGSAMRGAVNGAPLKMVLNITKKADLWVLSQKNILRVEDLRGKMIGVGGNWGTQFYLVLEALKHYGADKMCSWFPPVMSPTAIFLYSKGACRRSPSLLPIAFWRSARAIGIWYEPVMSSACRRPRDW